MTRGAAEPRERFFRLAAAVREPARADFAESEPPLIVLAGIGAIVDTPTPPHAPPAHTAKP